MKESKNIMELLKQEQVKSKIEREEYEVFEKMKHIRELKKELAKMEEILEKRKKTLEMRIL